MSNTIKLKRGSGSDPSASDLSIGEIAIRTDSGKLFTKKDNGSVAEISGSGGIDDGDKGDITISNGGDTFTIDSGVIDNANIASNAAIAGTKISPDFGSQNVATTGTLASGNLTITSTQPFLSLQDSNNENDFEVGNAGGLFRIRDVDAATNRLTISSAGVTTIAGNLDVGAGVDVTGNISATGDITITNDNPRIFLTDTNNNDDFSIRGSSGMFRIRSETDAADRLVINSDGHVDIAGNLDVGNGIDVEDGDITLASGHTVDGRDVSADGSKLDGIESGATADQTASEILTLLKTVDGAGSGLDADTLDGVSSASFLRSDAADTCSQPITFSSGIILPTTGEVIKFGPGTAANDDAHIEWLGGSNAGYLRFSTSDDSDGTGSSEYIEFGDYPTQNRVGTFTQHLRISRDRFLVRTGSNSISQADRLNIDSSGTVDIYGNLDVGAGLDVTGDINCTSDLILDSTNTDHPRITLHSNATGINKYAIINGQAWNPDALLVYDLDGDQSILTVETSGLGIKRGANSISHCLDVGGTAMIRGATEIQGNISLSGNATTTNQNRTISFTGFDKESTNDFTDNAFIRHTTNTGGLGGSVLEIGSLNDSNDGIAFNTNNHNNNLRLNGNKIWNAGNDGSGSGLDSDLLDGQEGSYYRNAGNINAGTIPAARIGSNAVTFARMQDIAEERLIGRVSSGSGDPEALTQAQVRTFLGLASSATTDTTNASNISSGTVNAARLPNNYTKAAGVTIQSTGAGNDVLLDAADHIILESGEEEDGCIFFRGNSGVDSYRFSKGGQTAIEGFLSFESLTSDRTFTFPNSAGTIALTSDIPTNNNQLSNGAGYITSADGGNAATLDSLDSTQFLRSDASDTMTGSLTIGDGSAQTELLIKKADNNVSDHLQFYNGTTRMGEIGVQDTTWLRINQSTNKNIYTPRYIRADNGFFVDGTSKGINGSGNFIGGTIAGASDYGTLVRSNASDTLTGGTYTFDSSTDQKIILQGSGDPYIRFKQFTTEKAFIQWQDSNNCIRLRNQEDNAELRIKDDLQFSTDASTFYSIWHAGNDGSGSGLDSDTVDGIQGASLLRSDAADTASGDITFTGGAGAVTIGTGSTGSDIRFVNGTWTGNTTAAKIQLHSNYLYIAGGSNGIIFRENGTNRWAIDGSGHYMPKSDSTYNIGSNSMRVANGYFDTLYGDGSNLTGISAGATGGGSDEVFYENGQTVTTSYTITNGKNAMAAGPITINSGVTVTVGSGENLTIV